MRKKISVSVAVAITLIAMTVTFSITMIVSMNLFDTTVSDVLEKQALYNKISELDTYVRANYYGDIDDEYLNDRVASGFIDGLSDSQSTYYNAETYALLQDIESGKLVNVGLVGTKDAATGYFRIIKVYENSPAAAQGLRPGLLITSVETGGESYSTKSFSSSSRLTALLRGEQGTTVTLHCENTQGETSTYNVQRVNYKNPTVEMTIENQIAYIRIYSFAADTAADFDYYVRDAEAQGVAGLVFDLRGTTSTSVDYAYDMIDLLCPRGNIARAELKNGVIRSLRMSDEEFIDLPMVCIVNGSTASAAELFATCVRDLAGGQIVGERTAGMGLLQRAPYQLLDGSAVVVTYARLYAGESESFDGVGLEPDLEVAFDMDDERAYYNPDFVVDTQIRRSLELVRSMAREQGLSLDPGNEEPDGTTSALLPQNESEPEENSLPEEPGTQEQGE